MKIPKTILLTAKVLQFISLKLVIPFAAKLFTTPIKHKIPKRENEMDKESVQNKMYIPEINKEIVVYHYGKSERKILLVHGWSGRGTQLVKIADALIEQGFSTVSFDAPAHGKSQGNNTLMPEFIASIIELQKQMGPFEYAIGHSLGGMAILNAITKDLHVKKTVIIGSGDIIQDIIDDFVKQLQLKPVIGIRLKEHFESKFKTEMDSFSASRVAKKVETPTLILHDIHDTDVNVKAAHHIHQNLKNSELIITEGLGHRKILGNDTVIKNILTFIQK